eukprot:CAMPEP_0114574226 /NCGR_PEP_ID=MMETSP0114-20121206/19287_1 /TAXON_ID=31324 /ORGANISM="Goniomonas sp, Strain m" /LENGTH=33 /DNA_ID= /DNA_START= /DNA_END= /DNA_ORIENTATION=
MRAHDEIMAGLPRAFQPLRGNSAEQPGGPSSNL